ncbi:MAG TPA: ABC-F family ATPase [Casimicrobiaceae bacterium]|nr:ABC-F family ATPase [Casimicrobiaceae bacterium]
MLTASNITLQFGAKPLFENVSIKFGEGNRYGLIGANGCGKSTFMKILGGDLEPSAGNVSIDPGERLGKLKQDQFAYEDLRVLDVVMMGHERLWNVLKERDAIYANPDASDADYLHAAELEAKVAELDGYTAEARASELLLGVEIEQRLHDGPMANVAPGYKLRVLLAQALFADPDILLLDEPTNHLDINTIRWLEGVLNARSSTIVVISHDRHFLNSVCTHMADLDYRTLSVYPGSYDDYMIASTQARERLLSQNSKAKDRIAELEEFVRRFRANKSKARQATSRAKAIEKIKIEDVRPSSRQNPYIRFEIDPKAKLHRTAVEIAKLGKAFDQPLFSDLSMLLEAGKRLAIIGANGSGKTTLLRTLLGELAPDRGTVKWAEKATVGYYPQDQSSIFESDIEVFDWMKQWALEGDDDQAVRSVLGKLLFSGDDVGKPLRVLSGGERGRMLFGKLMLTRPNVLMMDEPTNHMDMESIESLNLALERYAGTLIFISHDRQFVSSLATHVIELGKGEFTEYDGSYDDYLLSKGAG